MNWNQIKKRAAEFIIPELQDRVQFYITSYHKDRDKQNAAVLGRGWITVDGEEVLTFSGRAAKAVREGKVAAEEFDEPPRERQELYDALRDYPDLALDAALSSSSVVIRGLAMIDRRLGKRRLAKIDVSEENRFVRQMFELRKAAKLEKGER